MKRCVLAAVALSALAGCTTANHSIGSVQFNSEAEAFPNNYREVALRMVEGRETIAPLQISEPLTMVGETVFSPMRWYVCISGSHRTEQCQVTPFRSIWTP